MIAAINQTTYKAESLGFSKPLITIGGSDASKFVPNVHALFFNGEYFFNINEEERIIDKESASITDDKISQSFSDGITDEYFINEKGRLKWNKIFSECPKSFVIRYKITCSENLYYIQATETVEDEYARNPKGAKSLEEFKENFQRDDDVWGSISVHCLKRDNKYGTGKLFDIYAPFVIDSKGNKHKCRMWIDNGYLYIELPQKFMETALYPTALDPELGYNTAGASSYGIGNYGCGFPSATDSNGGKITGFHCAIASFSDTPANIKMCVAATSGGSPNSQDVLEQIEFAGSVSDDCNATALGTTELSASTTYAVLLSGQAYPNRPNVKYDGGGGGFFNSGQTYASAFSDPLGTGWNADDKWSVWITYGNITGTSTGLRISAIDGTAFIDNDSYLSDLCDGVQQIKIYDSSMRVIQGVLSVKGTGETYTYTSPDNCATSDRTEDDATTGWSMEEAGTLASSNADPQSGSYHLDWRATAAPFYGAVYFLSDATFGKLYYVSVYAKKLSGYAIVRVYNVDNTGIEIGSSYTRYEKYLTALGSYFMINIYEYANPTRVYIDNVIVRQILTPSAKGAVIKDLSDNQNWISKESGFNFNEASYTYELVSAGIEITGNGQPSYFSSGSIDIQYNATGGATASYNASGIIIMTLEATGDIQPVYIESGNIDLEYDITGNVQPVYLTNGTIDINYETTGNALPAYVIIGEIDVEDGTIKLTGNMQPSYPASGNLVLTLLLSGGAQVVYGIDGNIDIESDYHNIAAEIKVVNRLTGNIYSLNKLSAEIKSTNRISAEIYKP